MDGWSFAQFIPPSRLLHKRKYHTGDTHGEEEKEGQETF